MSDPRGGLTRVIEPWGNIASCGMAGGHGLNTTVFPFILRGVSLLGVSSTNCDIETRRRLWNRLGGGWKPLHLDDIVNEEVALDGMEPVFQRLLRGEARGRSVVRIDPSAE